MNAKHLLDISEAAEMLQCSVAKVRQMVIGDQTLAAVHEDYRGYRAPFRLGGLRVFDVDEMGSITDVQMKKPAGWLRFDPAEVVKTLSERAHFEAAAVSLSDLIQPALSVPVESDSTTPSPATVAKTRAKRRTWRDVSSAYIIEVMRAEQHATCKDLYRTLEAKAGPESPFDKGTGANRGNLFVREIAQALSLKTVQNEWSKLRELAQK